MPTYPVKTDFVAKDNVSGAFKRMGKSADIFGNKSSRAFKKASKGATGFKSIVGGILTAGAVQRGTALMAQGIREVTTEFLNFDDAVTKGAAKFPGKIRRGTKEFEQLGLTARDIAKTTRFSASDAAGGLEFLAMAGFNAQQAMATLPGITDLAAVASTDLAGASDIASDALGAFNMMTKDTTQLTENLTKINDTFAAGITTFNMDLTQLFESAKMAGPVFTNASQSLATFTTAAGVMASAGIKATMSGTQLRTAMLNLQAPVPAASKLLKKLRIETEKNGKMRDFFDILGDVEKATANMGDAQKAATLKLIFGKRAIAGVSVLLNEGKDRLKDFRKGLEQSQGRAKDMADEMNKSLGARLDKLKNNLIEVGLKTFETFQDKFPGALDQATAAVKNFDVTQITDGIKSVIKLIKDTKKAIEVLTPFIWGAVTAWGAYKLIMMGVTAVQFVKYAMAAAKAAKAASVAQWLWNAALLANPIGLTVAAVAVAVGSLVALGYVIWDNWGFIWARLKEGWEVVADGFWRFVDAIKGGVFGIVDAFKNIFSGKAFTAEFKSKQLEGAKSPGGKIPQPKAPAPPPPRQAPNEAREQARAYDYMRGVITVQNQTDLELGVNQQTRNAPPPIRLELAGQNR